jgi:hypothetical protein
MAKVEFRKLGGGNNGGGFIEDTYANIATFLAAGTLIPGAHYKITDRADLGIILLALSATQLSLEGEGIFLNPDFQDVGNYDGVQPLTGVNLDSNEGIWVATGEGSTITQGDVVFWDGLHYQVVDDSSFDTTNPATNTTAYQVLPKTVSGVGYITETDFILYDFLADEIIGREDKRGNKIHSPYAVTVMQWGNDLVVDNLTENVSTFSCINQRGSLYANTLKNSVTVTCTNAHEGELGDCVFEMNGSYDIDLDSGIIIGACKFATNTGITVNPTIPYSNKVIIDGHSTFTFDLNMTDGTDYDQGTQVLTIPSSLTYIGVFTLINNTGQNIEEIVNLPINHKCRFYVEDGNTQNFVHNNIAGALANELVSDLAITNTVTGRASGSDFIEYEKSGDLNRRYNAVILA